MTNNIKNKQILKHETCSEVERVIFFANSSILLLVCYSQFIFPLSLGIESFSKLGDSIYFEEEVNNPSLYIIQYISSSFNWKSGNVLLTQRVVPAASSDPYLRVTFTFSPNEVPITLSYCFSFSHISSDNRYWTFEVINL